MKHVKLFEAFVNEKAYRMTSVYGSKGIVGKVMQAFKKEIEKIKYEGDAEATLKEVNKEWEKFLVPATEIILTAVEKATKSMDVVLFVSATLSNEWALDTVNKLNKNIETNASIYITPGETVINVGFMDDANANKYARKLGGMSNSPLNGKGSNDLYGSFDSSVRDNNIEIRDAEYVQIDQK
jgi:hypothetical protein